MKSEQTKRWPLRAILVGFLLMQCICADTLAQVIVSSRPMVHHEVDAVTCVTDYRDSVYVITKAGNVVAYNQDFTGERLVHEAMQLHATSAYVYDGALFFESSSGQYLINDNGRWQYVDLSPAVVSRDATMMPFAVTDFGVFELRRGGDGRFVPVQLGHRIQRQGSIYSMARIDDCIVVSYQDAIPPAPCTLHRSDGSVEQYPVNLGAYGVRFLPGPESSLIVAGWHDYYWILQPCVSTTNRKNHITDDNNAIRASGIFTRTGASAPWAHAVFDASWSASRLFMYDGTLFKKQVWYGGADSLYRHYNSATSDSAIYAWGNDGWVVRYGLTSGRVSVRRTIVPRRYRVQLELSAGDYRLLSTFEEVDNRDSAQHIFITNATATDAVPLEAFAEYSQRTRHGNVVRYHRYPSGSEIILTSLFLVMKDSSGSWRAKKLPNTVNTSGIGTFVLDDSTFVHRGVAYCERNGKIVELPFSSNSDVFSSSFSGTNYPYLDGRLMKIGRRLIFAHIHHAKDSVTALVRREYNILPTHPDTFSPPAPGDSAITLFSVVRGDSLLENFVQPMEAVIVVRLNSHFDVTDSFRVVPAHREPIPMVIPLGDTVFCINTRESSVKRITTSYETNWTRIPVLPGIAGLAAVTYSESIPRRDGQSTTLDFHSPERVHTIVFGKDSTTLSAQSTDALDNDVVLQHIFMMNVYPNPTSDQATLEMRRHQTSEASPTELFLADLSGVRVRDFSSTTAFTFPVGTVGRTTLDCTNLASGPYLLVMRNGGFTSSKLLMIAK